MLKYCLAFMLVPYFFLSAQANSRLIISEVMFFPQGSNNEFVEIFNLSENEFINLDSCKIKYANSNPDIISAGLTTTLLPPNSFAVVFEKDYDFTNGIYKDLIPDSALILKISDNSFGTNGMSNTSDRPVYLLNKQNDTLDFYTYSANNQEGFSDEKIFLNYDTNKTNWKNSIRLNGSPGFKNSVTPSDYDLELSSIRISPELIFDGDNAQIVVSVKNIGQKSAGEYTVKIFNDLNLDTLSSENELIFNNNFDALPVNDSINISTILYNLTSGIYNIIAVVEYSKDDIAANNKKRISFFVHPKGNNYNDIVINEIMYAPLIYEPEWIELFNRSDQEINLKNWKIGDRSTKQIITAQDININPSSLIIITKDSSIIKRFNIPVEIIKTNIPSLNNDGDSIVLTDSLGVMIDSLEYLPAWSSSGNGFSLERIDKDAPSILKSNWGSSVSLNKATPGLKNSIAIKEKDLGICNFYPEKPACEINYSNLLNVVVYNYAKFKSAEFTLTLYFDENNDSVAQHNELIKTLNCQSINPKDSSSFEIEFSPAKTGINRFIAIVFLEGDEDISNNSNYTFFAAFEINHSRNDLIINEIMFAPKTPQPEWIEILNNSKKQLDINGFRLADASDTVPVLKKSLVILPGEYFIIAADSSITRFFPQSYKLITAGIPSLNNSGDKVILLDSLNRVIDSLEYFSSWGLNINGASLERKDKDEPAVNKENWGASVSLLKATPGMKNSICANENDLIVTGFFPKYKSSNVTGTNEITATIKNSGKKVHLNFNVNFFFYNNIDTLNVRKELMKTFPVSLLMPNDSASFSVAVTSSTEGDRCYQVEIDSPPDEDTTNNTKSITISWFKITEERNDLVISEIMYAPKSPQPEWVEIYNRCDKTINLNGYNFADDSDTIIVTSQSLIIQPGEFLVIASDSTFFNFANPDCKVLIAKLPQLNNNGDKAIVLDKHNRVIDSVWFNSSWGGSDGKSLERIRNDSSSTGKSNWKSSINILGSTPGKKNSVSPFDYDIKISELKIFPEFPAPGDDISLSIKLINVGEQNCIFNFFIYIDKDLDSLPNSLLFSQNSLTLEKHDSVNIPVNSILKNIRSDVGFFIYAVLKDDEDTTNNKIYKQIRVVHPAGSIVVNEIMYNPNGGEPEWIELFNLTADSINLKQWIINDVITTPSIFKIPYAAFIPSKSYFVISRDSTIYSYHRSIPSGILVGAMPVLNNDEDGIVLKDFRGITIDTVFYKSTFGGKAGHSIERKSFTASANEAANWSASIDIEQSTPGRKNSIAEKTTDLKISDLLITPGKPYAGDSVNTIVKIKNRGSIPVSAFTVEFSFCNDTIISNLTLFENYFFEGSLNPGDSCNIKSLTSVGNLGNRFLFSAKIICPQDEDTTNNSLLKSLVALNAKNCIVVNEVMYDPKPNEPEWVEIINVSQRDINLNGWFISDKLTTPIKAKITNIKNPIKPNAYFIISKDSSFFNLYPVLNNITAVASFGQLNNNEDGIIIFDNNDSLITDISYKGSWGAGSGISLEKTAPSILPNDSLSWKPSLSITGSTPGVKNSVTGLIENKQHCLAINEIMFDPGSNNSEYIELLNISSDTIDIGGWYIKNSKGGIYKLFDFHYKLAPGNYFVIAADSGLLINYPYLNNSKLVKIVNTSGLGLENSGGLVLLKDFSGVTIDSVAYIDSWTNKSFSTTKNKSLERISASTDGNAPANWSSCVDVSGGTPGKQNSLLTIKKAKETAVSIVPNPFSPDGDGFEDFTEISYSLTKTVNSIRIRIFDSKGRLVRTLTNNQATGDSGNIIFNGMGDDGNPLRIGIYIVLFEAMNNLNITETIKTVVVIARKL